MNLVMMPGNLSHLDQLDNGNKALRSSSRTSYLKY
jgi:hypothetical protein